MPATPAMPTVITREQLRGRQRGEIGPDDQRDFRLADEDVGRGAQRFDAADAGDPADRAADPADDPLHDAEIIEDRDQRGEEDDHRQRARSRRCGRADCSSARAEQEFGALRWHSRAGWRRRPTCAWIPARPSCVQSTSTAIAGLQREGGADDAQADRAAVGRQQEGDARGSRRSRRCPIRFLIHSNASLPRVRAESTRPCLA